MMRLIKHGLMFGNLVEVSSSGMVARYNRALKHLYGKETALTEFHIDISGYSPEIGHEFGDDLYLNPKGCNRQFIIMTTEQKTAPLLNAQFSTSHDIIRAYIEGNENELFALTAREAVAGELLNSVYEINSPADLFEINQISIEADTIGEHVASAEVLKGHIKDFMGREDAWWDDVLISDMIEIAKQTGDIQRNPLTLKGGEFSQGNFYTPHFGGLYIFRDLKHPTVIARTQHEGLKDLPVDYVLHIDDRDNIARFLGAHGLAEMIVTARDANVAEIIKQKIDFIAIATAASKGDALDGITRQNVRNIEREYANDMPEAYHGLTQIWRWASMGGAFPDLRPEHEAYFYALRSAQHENRDLVNMLLADLTPLDFRQLFICHKDAFYEMYQSYSEPKRDYVSRFLAEEYAIDKAGARETLYGREPDTEAPLREAPKGPKYKVQRQFPDRDDDDDDDDDEFDYRKIRKHYRQENEKHYRKRDNRKKGRDRNRDGDRRRR